VRLLLLVEDNSTERSTIAELLQGADVQVTAVCSAEEALRELEKFSFDCVVVDLILPDLDGWRLIERIKRQAKYRDLPIIVYTSRDLTQEEEQQLKAHTVSVIVKSSPESPQRLLRDTALFLHRVEKDIPAKMRAFTKAPTGQSLSGKKVLVVDDDVRNVFAMTSCLEAQRVQVLYAEGGKKGVELLEKNPDTDAVLMDVMMPGMDGYEAIRAIRRNPRYHSLPIIAVTAKALKDDCEKCLQAGASDYLPKPVEPDRLLEVIRLWTQS
jgi:CheY-like chemotaxis protein